ncbi:MULTISPECIES: lipopolysaccharide assembly protein LapB [Kosmotoga]|uniref:Uncharacterized protein n=1 Tax=Kosmotoga olearia (strain ATCC BAA-1733 / DSM 21960 / TBF 19.5.1) TaxID=521045 RepID=C5CEK2_KOSOT|nr:MULTISPECIES: hypothetical protein [Kosmotoga]ACR79248.1 hypothetical protein Kole_0528 [Kosmotoga olearia TBF 19.5.1]OAA23287.1 hypothetical protein DU53_02790 [Kosmotoga sp. DU53]
MWSEYQKYRITYLCDLLEIGTDYTGPEFNWEELRQEVDSEKFDQLSSLLKDAFGLDSKVLNDNKYFLLYFWGIFLWDEDIPFETRFRIAQKIINLGRLIRKANEREVDNVESDSVKNDEEVIAIILGEPEYGNTEIARWYLLAGLDAIAFFLQNFKLSDNEEDDNGNDRELIKIVAEAMNLARNCPRFFLKALDITFNLTLGYFESTITSYALGLNPNIGPDYLELPFEVFFPDTLFGTDPSILSLVCLLRHEDDEVRRKAAYAGASLLTWGSSFKSHIYVLNRMAPTSGLLPVIIAGIAENTSFSFVGKRIINFLEELGRTEEKTEVPLIIRAVCDSLLKKKTKRKSRALEEFIKYIMDLKTNSRARLAGALLAQAYGYKEYALVLYESLSKRDQKAFESFVENGVIPKLRDKDSEESAIVSSVVSTNYEIARKMHRTIFEEKDSLFPGFEIDSSERVPSLRYNLPPREYYLKKMLENKEDKVQILEKVLEKHPYEFTAYMELANEYFTLGMEEDCRRTLETGVEKIQELLRKLNLRNYMIEFSHHHNRPILMLFKDFGDFLRMRGSNLAKATQIFEWMLVVEPMDFLNAKNSLLNCYFRQRNFIKAEKLLEWYEDENSLDFVMGRAFIYYIRRNIERANLELSLAKRMNPYVIDILLMGIDPEELDNVEIELEKKEAIIYALEYEKVWKSYPRVMRWLKNQRR